MAFKQHLIGRYINVDPVDDDAVMRLAVAAQLDWTEMATRLLHEAIEEANRQQGQ